MPSHVETTAAQGQAQVLWHGDMGYCVVADDHPPLHEYHGYATNNYAGVDLGVPAQAQVAPPAPVCLASHFRIQIPNQTIRRSRLTYSTTQFGKLLQALLKPSSIDGLTTALSPTGWPTNFRSHQAINRYVEICQRQLSMMRQ